MLPASEMVSGNRLLIFLVLITVKCFLTFAEFGFFLKCKQLLIKSNSSPRMKKNRNVKKNNGILGTGAGNDYLV